jgi:hypothetical protein
MSHRSPSLRFVIGSVGLAALAALPLLAQTGPPASQTLSLTILTLKPGTTQAYVEFQKNEVIPVMQKAGQPWRESWRTATFGDPFEIAHVTPISAFAQYDSPSPFRKAIGEAGYAAYLAKASTMVASQRTYAIRTRPDLSYMADGAARPKLAILTRVDVRADKLADFEAFIKGDWLSALKKGGGKFYSVDQVVYGGSTTEYMTLVGINSFADLDAGHPVTKALGEAGVVKLMATSGTFTNQINRTIIRLDPDLSFAVKGSASGN